MKRFAYFYFGAAALVCLSGCSSDEVMDSSQTPQAAIGFDGAFVNNSGRATASEELSTYINNSGFNVYGDMVSGGNLGLVFDNQYVSKASGDWAYTPIRYWIPGNEYAFSAFAPGYNSSVGGIESPGWTYNHNDAASTTVNLPHGVVSFDNVKAKGNVDLGYAYYHVASAAANQPKVPFTFNHLLSKVMVKFTNSFEASGSYVSVDKVSIESAGKGEFNLSQLKDANVTPALLQNTVWSNLDGTLATEYKFNNKGVPSPTSESFNNTGNATSSNWFYLFPSQAEITVNFDVILSTGGVVSGKWAHKVSVDLGNEVQGFIFKPGCSYVLVADINASNAADDQLNPIEFTVQEVNDWTPDGDVNAIFMGINASEVNLGINGTFTVVPSVTMGSITDLNVNYTYESSDSAVATVSAGDGNAVITGVTAGSADVTVTATVSVSDKEYVRSKTVKVTVAA